MPFSPSSCSAAICLPSRDLAADLHFFTATLGFSLTSIFPADDPRLAVLAGHGVRLRLERGTDQPPGRLHLAVAAGEDLPDDRVAPNGTVITFEVEPGSAPLVPPTRHSFQVRRLTGAEAWVIGRAGMHYRDLIPDRLGGTMIASHIRIPDGGPVPDMVHFHQVRFQLIYCYRGWVRLVYEDQGPPFVLEPGDCVIQPPEIRHRVLESSENLEVVEIGVPAEHLTRIDHGLSLPTADRRPERLFDGQRFCRHRRQGAAWQAWRVPGFEARYTGIGEATGGVADVHVVRPNGHGAPAASSHDGDILFSFILAGAATVERHGEEATPIAAGDAVVVPPGLVTRLSGMSEDFEFLEVALPGSFATSICDNNPPGRH